MMKDVLGGGRSWLAVSLDHTTSSVEPSSLHRQADIRHGENKDNVPTHGTYDTRGIKIASGVHNVSYTRFFPQLRGRNPCSSSIPFGIQYFSPLRFGERLVIQPPHNHTQDLHPGPARRYIGIE